MAIQQIEGPSSADGQVVVLDGRELRRLRKEAKLSQRDVADKVELSNGYISQIENDIRPISVEAAQRLCEFFGRNLGQLVKRESEPSFAEVGRTGQKSGDWRDDMRSLLREELAGYVVEQRQTDDPHDDTDRLFHQSLNEADERRAEVEANNRTAGALEYPSLERIRMVKRAKTHRGIDWRIHLMSVELDKKKISGDQEFRLRYLYESIARDEHSAADTTGQDKVARLQVRAELGRDLVSLLFHRGDLHEARDLAMNESDEIWRYLQEVKKTGSYSDLSPELVDLRIWLVEIYEALGQAEDAAQSAREARRELSQRGWPQGEQLTKRWALLHRVEGSVYIRQGEWTKALEALEKSLERGEELAAQRDRDRNEAFVLRELTRLALRQGEIKDAMDYCLRSYQLRLDVGYGDRAEAAYAVHTADAFRYREDNQEELYVRLSDAWRRSRRIGDQVGMARIQLRLSRNSRKRGLLLEAESWGEMTLEDAQRLQHKALEAEAHRQLGMAFQSAALRAEMQWRKVVPGGRVLDPQYEDSLAKAEEHLRTSYHIWSSGGLKDVFERAVAQRVLAGVLVMRAEDDPEKRTEAVTLLGEAWREFDRLGAKDEKQRVMSIVDASPAVIQPELREALASTSATASV